MSQIFHHSTNTFARITIFGAVFIIGFPDVGVRGTRPVALRDAGRAGARTAGAVQPCASCWRAGHRLPVLSHVGGNFQLRRHSAHQDLHELPFADLDTSPTLEPVRASFRTSSRFTGHASHDLPDFVYFNHSIHVNKGVGCETCHGRVDRMPLTWQENSLQMEWCLNCHRHPEEYVRPREFVTTMGYQPARRSGRVGQPAGEEYKIQDARALTSCSTCHR